MLPPVSAVLVVCVLLACGSECLVRTAALGSQLMPVSSLTAVK